MADLGPLRVVPCQAPNAEFVYREMAAFIERAAGLTTRYVDDVPWAYDARALSRA